VKALGLAHQIVLGDITDHLKIVKEERPDKIILGYDQKHFAMTLREDLDNLGLTQTAIVRIEAYKPHIFKTSLLRKNRTKAKK
jgi:glycerol-3-phosphate cytidylyltransferase-like family protein